MDDIPWGPDHPLYFETAEEFFGSDPVADLDRWSRVQHWTLEEGVALSFGFDPRVVNWTALGNYPEHPHAIEYDRRRDLADRGVTAGELQARSSPRRFIKWAKSVEIIFPDALEKMVKSVAAAKSVRDTRSSRSGLTKIMKTDSAIALGIVRDTYGFDPSRPVATTFAEIAADLQTVGISVDAETLQKVLQETDDLVLLHEPGEINTIHENLCKVIFGLAVKDFGHVAKARRSKAPKEIMKALEGAVKVDAIRDRLNWGDGFVG